MNYLKSSDHQGIEETEEIGREIEDGDGGQQVKLGLRLGNNAKLHTTERHRLMTWHRSGQDGTRCTARWATLARGELEWIVVREAPTFFMGTIKVWSVWLR